MDGSVFVFCFCGGGRGVVVVLGSGLKVEGLYLGLKGLRLCLLFLSFMLFFSVLFLSVVVFSFLFFSFRLFYFLLFSFLFFLRVKGFPSNRQALRAGDAPPAGRI